MTPTPDFGRYFQTPQIDAPDMVTELNAMIATLEVERHKWEIVMIVCVILIVIVGLVSFWLNLIYEARFGNSVPRWLRFLDSLRFADAHNPFLNRIGVIGWHLYGYAKGR